MDIIKKILREELERKSLSDMVFISYGTDFYDEDKFKEPNFNNYWSYLVNKPKGGLWASPLVSKRSWGKWCAENDFRIDSLSKHFLFTISDSSNIYIIDTFDDLKEYGWRNEYGGYKLDFKSMADDGYDGVFATDNAVSSLGFYGLASWDVESLCVFNKKIIQPIEETVFDKAKITRYEDTPDDEYLMMHFNGGELRRKRNQRQFDHDMELYGNQNVNSDMSKFFNGKYPGILAQMQSSKDSDAARRFNGTLKSGM